MRFSVWNHNTRRYDYYDAASSQDGTHVGAPPTPILRSPIGATPEQAAWKIPAGAAKVGSGPVAQGKIASLGDDSFGGVGVVPIALGACVLAYFLTR